MQSQESLNGEEGDEDVKTREYVVRKSPVAIADFEDGRSQEPRNVAGL